MSPVLAVPTLEASACSSLSRLLVQAFSKLEGNIRRTRRQEAGGREAENEVEKVLDCLPAALVESIAQKVLELLTSQMAGHSGGTGGWYASRVRKGLATFPGLPTALR